MAIGKGYKNSSSEYSVSYKDMLGVDLSTDGFGISPRRFAYAENMYKDYEGFGAAVTESVPGFRKILSTGGCINGIYSRFGKNGEVYVVVHSADKLYSFLLSDIDSASSAKPIFTLANRKSHARAYADSLYVFDGDGIVLVNDRGAFRVGESSEAMPYVPTTYLDGEEYEQRNLLTESFIERTFIGSCSDFGHGTRGFSYEILSDTAATAILTSGAGAVGDVYVPSSVRINGRLFFVTEIGDRAFRSNTGIRSVSISEGITKIGRQAFYKCTSLREVLTPDSIEEIGSSAFEGCTALESFHLGGGLQRFGSKCFEGCGKLIEINYSMNLSIFAEIENHQETMKMTILFDTENLKRAIEIPIYTPTKKLDGVTLDGDAIEYEAITENDIISAIVIVTDNKYLLEGREIKISATITDEHPKKSTAVPDVLTIAGGATARELIFGCTVSESFDGRIFVAGNPRLPNTVFYTARDNTGVNNPLYFGSLNYFSDGLGGHNTRALLATSNMLAVFKSGDDGCGSIFYHTPESTSLGILPKIYPTAYVHSGIYASGGAISFFDDPLFVSPLGVCALEKQSINLDRSIVCRSHNVNSRLLTEKAEDIRLAEWCGYLAVLGEGRIYLADSRAMFTHQTGGLEYEWYFLSDIGTYKNDRRVYRYASTEREGFTPHKLPSAVAEGEIFSELIGTDTVYYVKDGSVRYEVLPTEEFTGGEFSPAVELLGIYGYLIFGTRSGDVCVFNNDKRGVPPERIASLPDFDAEEYSAKMSRRIHTDFYSFAGHAPRYALKTAFDNCSIAHLTKSTVKGSLTLKCRAFTKSRLVCEVGTDISGYKETTSFPGTDFDFSSLDFSFFSSNTSQSFSVPIAEREKGWIEKQITLYSDEFASPFGIYSINYRFTVKGKIKKQ